MDSFVPVPSWAPGRLIAGRYRVEERLGRGAMGAVYRVLDERSSERVALKRMRPPRTLRRELARAHFEREYHVLAGLAHPRIIEVYDYGLDGETPFYTMELLDGADLRTRGQLPWRDACALLCDVASCLAILHSRRMVHRDVSARNVRRTSDGRAKLLDFGGMAPMGVVQEVIGTPPHVPPEAIQRQALDARADIFSLGVLGYYMLTGHYPYPATLLTELPDVWRTTPHRVRELVADVPEALSDLIGQMIQLNRMSRPASAAEVMERLCAIAAFPLEEHAEVRRAYLITPSLVGRERACARIRERLVTAMQGQGCPIWIEGAAGSGRSRLLEASVLESKLLGMAALRVAASQAPDGDYGAMRALCADVLEVCPELARQCAHFHGAVLASVIDGLEPDAARAEPPSRRQLQIALRDFWLAIARQQPLLIAVDDFDRIDEPSAAVLAALAHRAKQRGLVLAVTAETRPERAPALTLMRDAGVRVELTPLSVEDTEALIRSVFGDVDHTVLVARRIHELSEGNPRAAMAVAEHLVDRGLARYASGGWLLPERRSADDLPASVAEALQSRLRELGADARELADLLALAQESAFDPSRLAPLFADGDAARAYRAVGELLTSGVLAADGERYKFAQRALPGVLARRMTQVRRRDLHARLAALSAHAHETTWQAHHLFECGDEQAAVQLLLEHRRAWRSAPQNVAPLLDAALRSGRVELTRRSRCELLMWRLTVASTADDVRAFHLHLSELCAHLRADSGLADFEALGNGTPADARLQRAVSLAQVRHDDLPESERGHDPFKAISLLSRLALMTSGVAAVAFDLELIERLPSLAPLAPVLPAIEAVMLMVEATRSVLQGRSEAGHQIYHRALALLDRPDRAGMSPAQHRGLRLGIIYTLGLLEAALGRVGSLELLRDLDDAPDFRANAYRVRAVSHFMLGDASAAVECQRQAELLQLQEDGGGSYFGASWNAQLIARRLMDDLTGVKRALDAITELCSLYPCWLPILHWARYEYLRIQGDHAGALAAIESALAISAPARCVNWPQFAEAHVHVLLELDRPAQALAYAERYAAICDELELAPSHRALWSARGMALVKLGHHAEGVKQIERSVREYERIGVRGLIAGHYCEQRARAAIWMKDGAGFRRWAERAASEYQRGRNAALAARYARLVQEAERAGLVPGTRPMPSYPPAGAIPDGAAPDARTSTAALRERMAACQDGAERARCALQAIVDASSAQSAHLYGVQAGRLTALAVLGEAESAEIGIILEQQLSAELCVDAASAVTVISAARTPLAEANRVLEREGRVYRALALQVHHGGERTIVAMLALGFVDSEVRMPPGELLEAIARALLLGQDVDPLTCIASTTTS